MSFKNILFPTDFSSCADSALKYALYFAKAYRAKLHMLHGVVLHSSEPVNYPELEKLYKAIYSDANKQMDVAAQSYNTSNIHIVRMSERGPSASSVILDYANSHNIDLIVMGTHGYRGIKHVLFGSVAEQVSRFAKFPVITVRENNGTISQPKTILVPIDFSEYSKHALIQGADIARKFHCTMELLHVVEQPIPPPYYMTADQNTLTDIVKRCKNKAADHMLEIAEEILHNVGYNLHVETGTPTENIVQYTKDCGADLIIMGSHGLSGFKHFLLGSHTEKVLRTVQCPVMTVKLNQ